MALTSLKELDLLYRHVAHAGVVYGHDLQSERLAGGPDHDLAHHRGGADAKSKSPPAASPEDRLEELPLAPEKRRCSALPWADFPPNALDDDDASASLNLTVVDLGEPAEPAPPATASAASVDADFEKGESAWGLGFEPALGSRPRAR
jgi:hypothetical protein